MDVFFQYASVTEISLYNCSALPENEFSRSTPLRRPVRGVASFIFGSSMIIIYIACLRVMVKLGLARKACYKIMFVIGLYEIMVVLINDVFFAYSLAFGLAFCDVPNTFYTVGCFHIATWAGVSYLFLLLSFNRIMEILRFKRELIEFFYSPVRTTVWILIGVIYSLCFVFFSTPAVYVNDTGTPMANPLGLEMPPSFQMRHLLMIVNNCGVLGITCILYGIFGFILRKNLKVIGLRNSQNRLKHQVFIQSTLMCWSNFLVSSGYAFYLILNEHLLVLQICFFYYQFTSGLQALIYLLCNQTIMDDLKDDWHVLVKFVRETTTDNSTKTSPEPATNVVQMPFDHEPNR